MTAKPKRRYKCMRQGVSSGETHTNLWHCLRDAAYWLREGYNVSIATWIE